jgi:SAM-dependent methyltransferase
MASRTCRPDADFKLLWRSLMPSTPFPACGVAEQAEAPVTSPMTFGQWARFHHHTTAEIFLSEFERWEARYAPSEYAFGKEPNYFLRSCKGLLPSSGRALAVADGEARNGVWLAEQGLDVLSLDFSPTAQKKARALATERHVAVTFTQADVHAWNYPEAAFDVVVEIFTQFSSPAERSRKWAGMRRALKPGGLLILQGYTPKQLDYGTGGPKEIEKLYTRPMLEKEFSGFRALHVAEEEREIHEGTSHGGMSAVINLTGKKP